ncbi:MAG: hemerythrin domain-containing protein [Omnitrophica bacterium]|nr:hemerythrin domain-containing protein [Candidatus Omnitrophota bacterium]
MEEYLNTPIKEIITKFPKVGEILEEYNIGCVPCKVGSCLLKDIMEIHNLPENEERELLRRIAQVIYPGKKIEIPRIERKNRRKAGDLTYSPPMKKLVDEHVLIKKLVAAIPKIIKNLDPESEKGREVIRKSVDFIRFYADKYHHAKEEEILFKYFDENLDILKVIHEDHESARAHVRAILEGLDKKDKGKIAEHLMAYHELLTEHIKKEDEILYPWMDRNLSTAQVGELFSKFNEADGATDKEVIGNCKKFVEELEKKYKIKKEAVK